MEQTLKYVYKPHIARKLLKEGFTIVDLKPLRNLDGTTDFSRCTFVFLCEDGIDELIEKLVNKQD